jgi:hypothetical protein
MVAVVDSLFVYIATSASTPASWLKAYNDMVSTVPFAGAVLRHARISARTSAVTAAPEVFVSPKDCAEAPQSGVKDGLGVEVSVSVGEGVGEKVGVRVTVGMGVLVKIVPVMVGVELTVGVPVGVGLAVGVAVFVKTGVAVGARQ